LLNLVFALVTHPALFAGSHEHKEPNRGTSLALGLSVLAAATAAVAWMSEILVGVIEPTTTRSV